MRRDRGSLGIVALTAVLYLAADRSVSALPDRTELGVGFWPGAGITLAALLLTRRGTWPFILAAVGVVELATDLIDGDSLLASSLWTLATVAGPLVVATLVRVFGGAPLSDVRSMVRFLLAVTVGAFVVGGPLGALGTALAGTADPLLVVVGHRALADALGMVAIAPAVLLLRSAPERASLHRLGATVSLFAVVVASLTVFLDLHRVWDLTFPYLVLPALVWVALRYHLAGAAVATLAIVTIATVATGMGTGPFAFGGADAEEAALLLQIFLATTTVTSLLLGARSTESRRNERDAAWQQRRAEHEAALRALSSAAQLAHDTDELRTTLTATIGPLIAPATVELVGAQTGSVEVVVDGPVPDDRAGQDLLLDDVRRVIEQAVARLAAEAALSEANQALRAALSARDRFLSIVSHELRTPLTPIVGFSELLLERAELAEEDRAGLQSVARQGRHLTELVDRLLLLTELTERGVTPNPQRVRVTALVHEVVSELDLSGVEIRTAGPEMVWFDPDQLRQVIGDLLVNAHRFGEPPVTVSISGSGEALQLFIEDHGPGIPADFRTQVFEPFAQPAKREVSPSTGLGIGLALAKVLVEANGGTIEHQPRVGGGARFVLTLPAATSRHTGASTAERPIHDALLYTEPGTACTRIADWLLPGLVAGLPTVVIATEEHRQGIAEALEATAGDAFARARVADRYIELDARGLLDHLLIDGVPDTALLGQLWEQLLARVGGQPLQLFGEMTALALADGFAPAALQLEELWDGLARDAACDIYCAFPHAAVHDAHGLSLADRISDLHGDTTVVGLGP